VEVDAQGMSGCFCLCRLGALGWLCGMVLHASYRNFSFGELTILCLESFGLWCFTTEWHLVDFWFLFWFGLDLNLACYETPSNLEMATGVYARVQRAGNCKWMSGGYYMFSVLNRNSFYIEIWYPFLFTPILLSVWSVNRNWRYPIQIDGNANATKNTW